MLTDPLCEPPFDAAIVNALADEYRALPWSARFTARRKWLQREGLLRFSGQAALRRERVQDGVRRVLWVHTWTTVGDAVMDLAPRSLVPDAIAVELLIAPSLAPLFAGDARFAKVHTDPAAGGGGHDFVLLDALSTRSIRLKARHFSALPFASLRGHLVGERFDRAAYSDCRIRQLFGLAAGEVVAPWLSVAPAARGEHRRTRVAVALGARVATKHYPRWAAVLPQVVQRWPLHLAPPEFWMIGHGGAAQADLHAFSAGFMEVHGVDAVDRGSLRDAATSIAGCDAFLGVDGGLMHIAAALGVPGLALFTATDPRYFLRPNSAIEALATDGPIERLLPAQVAEAFVARCARIAVPTIRGGQRR